MTEPLPCPHHEDAHYPDRIVDHWKKPAEQWMVMYCCPECAHTFSDIGDTEEEADERALKGWNERYIPSAKRVIAGKTTKHYECEYCEKPVDQCDDYCSHCGRKLVDQ